MKSWSELTHTAGFDWATDHHDVVVVDRPGNIVAEFAFPETAAGWKDFSQRMNRYPAVAIAIETCQGPAVERLLQLNCAVYPINPQSAKAYRKRKAPSGAKTDRFDLPAGRHGAW
jgi:transposase